VILGDAEALILKICVKKIIKIYSRQGAASKMFRDTSANSSFSPVDFSKIGKFTLLWVKIFTQQVHFYAFLQVYHNSFRDFGMQLKVRN
jgi:hypothetical protein